MPLVPPPDLPQLLPDTPVLLRGPDEVQVGLDPDRAVLLRGAATPLLVSRLDGRTAVPDLYRHGAAAGLTPAEVDSVLVALRGAGLLTGSRPARAGGGQVRLVGLASLGRQVAALLLESGVDVHAADLERSGAPPSFVPDREAAAPGTAWGRLSLVSHWSKPDGGDLGLTVVAADTAEVDRVLTEHLLRTDQPHLLVRSTGTTVTVGPLVVPGRTACVRCCDLGRCDADPAWPVVLRQLTRLRLPLAPVLGSWAASVAASQTLAFLAGAAPESAGATLELCSRDHLMRWRAWPRHPACGCTWSGTTQWGP